ncbi:hypothetical protein CACET_c11120 [Clostridium aceticum]|uniref:Uncharacterized protein n=1 Tax=Clostridium aceticum TaxID=84022 RepID=A0A0G3W9K5_9CLOT|nr:hypothetical protein [Clostridium aceticum]AKL94577.1 hypothetical protein CACET_c11120 [Clostridium aceticum]
MTKQNTSQQDIKNILETIPNDTVIGEFSGRDSVAAILKALEDASIQHILPVASLAPTEYGDFQSLEKNYQQLVIRVKDLYGEDKTIFPLIYYSNPDLWSIINGRFVNDIHRKFDFYSPCIGCHAYFHLLRVPMALKLGKKIISGERESHDGRIKINQLSSSLSAYKKITEHFGVELLIPLRYMEDGDEVEKLIGWEWQEGKDHPSCVYSGNYKDIHGRTIYDEEKIQAYLKNFLYPVCIQLGEVILKVENPNKSEMVEALKRIGDTW